MPFFKRNKQSKVKPDELTNGAAPAPVRARWQSTWTSAEVLPEEIEELVHSVTAEMKLRAEALDSPFLLLPFRPSSDPSPARSFINNFFKTNASGAQQYRGASLQQELRLTNPTVLCSILKWCWSRMPRGVVSWSVYESFQLGEKEAGMARNAFDTFVPLGSDSQSRTNIIVDFFDLIAAVAAHGKMNGLGGRKLSRLAGWWAFEHSDGGKGFEGGYKSWSSAADASSHLFFAYLRSLSPDVDPSMNVIERIPRSLQALLAQTEYPPEAPALLQRTTPRVVMVVDQVSPSPFSLLRRAKHFEYRQNDRVLREYSEFDDPVDALTDECKRVLYAIASTNSSAVARSRHRMAKPDETWSSFTNMGFSDINSELQTSPSRTNGASALDSAMSSSPRSRNADIDRPTTPSWGDFLSSGFQDEVSKSPSTMLLPPDKVLPPINSRTQTPSIMSGTDVDEDVTPGELAAITSVELDDAFWWVWMTSLAGEEPNDRKAVFGRCALIETSIMNGRWLIMEEQVKGASPDPLEGAQVVEKKSRFSFTRRSKLGRGKSTNKRPQQPPPVPQVPQQTTNAKANRLTIGVDQQAKIKAAAAELARKNDSPTVTSPSRRGRMDEGVATKTNSTMTMGLQSEAGPAMKWANSYDKSTIRSAYLGSNLAGTGQAISTESLIRPADSFSYAQNGSHTNLSKPVQPRAEEVVAETAPEASIEHEAVPEPISKQQTHIPEALPQQQAHLPDAVTQQQTWVPETASQQQAYIPEVAPYVPEPVVAPQYIEPIQKAPSQQHVEAVRVADHAPITRDFGQPTPSPQAEHPALRHRGEHTSAQEEAVPYVNPAILAAKMALQGRAVSPESTKSGKAKKSSGTGGLKKFFTRNKDKSNRRRSQDVNPGALSAANDAVMNRKLLPAQHEETHSQTDEPELAPPIMPASQGQYNSSSAGLSRVDSEDQRDADLAFSRFDQGPMEDMPAVAPRDSADFEDAAEPPTIARYSPRSTQLEHIAPPPPPVSDGYYSSHSRVESVDDAQSEMTMEEHKEIAPVVPTVDSSKDRWERIRENAARRAANTRASEDTSTVSRPTESGRTDDGETSGEETIESRVARIKARVAELTGNMDNGPHSLRR
ncbi:hypothetical protein AMS68_001375 [Peltaster fructicola]|uniref:Meiotically up-regulated protein Msb1/Mug8 domain-containing protein n=1 Tax=Peltaster fructicola TaxID=286661 RepID=A0A6H0XMK6_9PEZI|nr:hypothetical protein AMS68_001375 [Peltaster fructicola]